MRWFPSGVGIKHPEFDESWDTYYFTLMREGHRILASPGGIKDLARTNIVTIALE